MVAGEDVNFKQLWDTLVFIFNAGWGHIGCWGDGAMVWRAIHTTLQCTVGRCSSMVHDIVGWCTMVHAAGGR